METNLNLSEWNLTEMDNTELLEVQGGDQFMRDLGYAVGYSWGFVSDNWKELILIF